MLAINESYAFCSEGGSPSASLEAPPAGLEPARHRRSAGGQRGGGHSVSAAVSAQGQLHGQVRARAFDAVAVREFLRHLLRMVSGPVLVIWDGAPIHRSKIVKAFLQAETNGRLELEPLPGYAPDLNPLDCGVWHWLKDVALANVCATDLANLKQELREAVARLRRKPSVIQASFTEAKLN